MSEIETPDETESPDTDAKTDEQAKLPGSYERGDLVTFTPQDKPLKCKVMNRHESGLYDIQEEEPRDGEEFQRWYQSIAGSQLSPWTAQS